MSRGSARNSIQRQEARKTSRKDYLEFKDLQKEHMYESHMAYNGLCDAFCLLFMPTLMCLFVEYCDFDAVLLNIFGLFWKALALYVGNAVCHLIETTVYKILNPPLREQMGLLRLDPYFKESILIWCLFEGLRSARDKRGKLAAITTYLQAHVNESLPLYAYRVLTRKRWIRDWTSEEGQVEVENMLEEAFGASSLREAQDELLLDENSGLLRPQDGNDGKEVKEPITWNDVMEDAFSNWKTFRGSTMAKRFTHLVNVLVSAGLCSASAIEFKMGNVSLFTPVVIKKQLAAGDVFEAFYEAASGFFKGGWRVYQTGVVSAFYQEDDRVSEFDRMYNEIRSWHGYAITGNLREYTEIDDNEYENRLNKAIEYGGNLLDSIKRSQTFERKYINDRLDRLRDNSIEFTQLRTRGGLRIAPFAVCLFGRSGCGKSSLTNLTVNSGLVYNDLSAEKDRIATWADNDKYASSIRSHINAIVFDDFANTNSNFMDFSPAYRLIQVINNIRYLAPMADVFLKGKVSLNPYFCVVSTNVEHLNAAEYSNEPESVLRRLYHVKVVPKTEYCTKGILDKTKIRAEFGLTETPDVWKLTIRQYKAVNKKGVDLSLFEPIEFEGEIMQDIPVKKYLRWLQIASKAHFTEEGQMVALQEGIPKKCHECGMVYCDCWTDREQPSNPPLEENAGVFETYNYVESFFMRRTEEIKEYYQKATEKTVVASQNLLDWWTGYDYLPESWICHPRVLKTCLFFWREDIKHSLYAGNSFIGFMMLVAMYAAPYYSLLWLFSALFGMYYYTCATVQTYQHIVRERILELKQVVKEFTDSWQFRWGMFGLVSIGLILAVLKERFERAGGDDPLSGPWPYHEEYCRAKANNDMIMGYNILDQSGINPENMDDINERNDQVNQWAQVETVPLPMSAPARTTTADNLARSMQTNIIGIVSDINKTTLGFYVCSNFVVVPTHFIKKHGDRDINIRAYKTRPERVGGYFRDKISVAYSRPISGTDFTMCYLTSGGSMKDFRNFLPIEDTLPKCGAKLVTRGVTDSYIAAVPTLFKGSAFVSHTSATFWGGYYDLPVLTQDGMCMSPLVSDTKGSVILGFHLGGRGHRAGCGTLTLDQVNAMIVEMSCIDGVVLSASSGNLAPNMGDFPHETYGEEILTGTDIHQKSATRFLPQGAFADVYGTTKGKATPYSRVVATKISDAVTTVFGVPQKWGMPKMRGKGRYPYQATLEHSAVPSLPIGSILAKACGDIKNSTTKLRVKIPELFDCGPLSRVATVSGISGKKFIDAMNFNTSPGFPKSGSKHPLLVDLDPEDHPDIGKPRTFVPEVWDEFDKSVDILMSGKRCYLIWKSCLKDEPTKLTKDKVRVFQSAPLVMQLLIRMYFLPLIRIIQLNPMLYECAVGVNAEGLDWQEIWDYAMEKGSERVLAGDYSKYDVRMPAQVTIAAFDILIDIAEKCDGYSDDDLLLMRNLVHEVVYPVLAYNGDLIQLFGTNPSGQNLTVIINSLVNSLLLRSCFYSIYPDKDFREETAFLTYGDDVIGTVSAKCPLFTHITYADWLSKHDMKFTMPDKESTPTPYMKEEDVDFLKRKCAWNEDLGVKVGLLSEDSIYKRLHAHLLSKELTMDEHSATNIESSIHDWFYYGRDVYEDRRAKLRKVAEMAEISHLCPGLEVSYDRRVARWRHKYLGEELDEEDENVCLE